MGLFDKIFKSEPNKTTENSNPFPWNNLSSLETLDKIVEDSYSQPVAILKHSTSCGISRMVLRQFENEFDAKAGKVKLYFLDLISNREVSNRIASKFNVPHESPQIILIKDGKSVYDASHSAIQAESLINAIN
ncbi:MAG: bacillithiol system redox-active protein YtxJ [Bacteroidota bacterium]